VTQRKVFRITPTPKVLGVILAGGEGRRLWPLTAHRAKPAVPFGGSYRIIDFVLSNFVNSGIHKIKVLTQYKSDSLLVHLFLGWHLSSQLDEYVEPVPAQQRMGKQWFQGSADALYQSLNVVADEDPDFVCVFGGDHIYRMDVRQMLSFHIEREAELTVAAVPVPSVQSRQFGICEIDADGRLIGFQEKPEQPKEIPGRPGWCLASMGNYIFDPDVLVEVLTRDAKQESAHDFGRNILPMLYPTSRVYAYNFGDNEIPGMEEDERGYWRDVGTIESYWSANMDLAQIKPVLNLYNDRWPIRTELKARPPAKFVFADQAGDRVGIATDSLVSPGCIISGGRIDRSILFPGVRINSFSFVEESVLFDGVNVGRYCHIRRAIIDKDVEIPPRTDIGHDLERDRKVFHVSDEGIVVVHKGYKFENRGG
jgi:glucose-1-phosphate adenylyltransferase